jgi:cytochrome d ubiquinol oxidase subunit II
VITVVAAILTPVVLLYQGWTYHVFRARLGGEPPVSAPVEVLGPSAAGTPTG